MLNVLGLPPPHRDSHSGFVREHSEEFLGKHSITNVNQQAGRHKDLIEFELGWSFSLLHSILCNILVCYILLKCAAHLMNHLKCQLATSR